MTRRIRVVEAIAATLAREGEDAASREVAKAFIAARDAWVNEQMGWPFVDYRAREATCATHERPWSDCGPDITCRFEWVYLEGPDPS